MEGKENMNKELLSREEFEKAGFIYEPDITKCKSCKLHLYVPSPELIDDAYKAEIISQVPFACIHKVARTINPYPDDPDYLEDPMVLVIGHTRTANELDKVHRV